MLTNNTIQRIFTIFMTFLKTHNAATQWCVNLILNAKSLKYPITELKHKESINHWIKGAFVWGKTYDNQIINKENFIYWSKLNAFWQNKPICKLITELTLAFELGYFETKDDLNRAINNMIDIVESDDYEIVHKHHDTEHTTAIDQYLIWCKTHQGFTYWGKIHDVICPSYDKRMS